MDGAQLDRRCCFGDASAATKCARISNYLVFQIRRALREFDAQHPVQEACWVEWQAERAARLGEGEGEVSLHWVSMYIDDSIGVSADDLLFDAAGAPVTSIDGVQLRRAQAHFDLARSVLQRYGWRSAPRKEQPPALVVEALGVELDLGMWRMRLTQAKRDRYAQQARDVCDSGDATCSRVTFEQLLGRLQFAAQCFPVGRQHMHACWRLARAQFRLRADAVRLSSPVRRDLRWWVQELTQPEHTGVPLAARSLPPVGPECGVIYADASLSSEEGGFMAWTVVEGALLYVEGQWSPEERRRLSIAELELLASTFGLVALAPSLPPCVVSFTDNTVAGAVMRSAAPRTARLQWLAARRTMWLHEQGRLEGVGRVTSRNNVWADLGSRGQMPEVLRQAAELQISAQRVSVPPEWRDTTELLSVA